MNNSKPLGVIESGMGSSATWLGTARSLGQQGVTALRLAPYTWYSSKYCTTQLSPNIHTEPQTFLTFLLALGRRLHHASSGNKPVLFPSSDDGLILIAQNIDALQPYFEPIASDWEIIRLLVDKRETYRHAHALSIPIPHTFAPQDITDVRQMMREVTYPCLLKPRLSHRFWPRFRVKLLRIQTPTELLQCYQAYPQIPWLIQEEILGSATHIFTLRTCLNRVA